MEPDSVIPLMETTGGEDDDDFLVLPQLPDPDSGTRTLSFSHNVNNSPNLFACSPIQLSMIKPRLPTSSKGLKNSMDPAKPSCSSPQSSINKENINLNKSEVSKLNVEPVQMKKRKKGGRYNLRKSLAWDKAFDTDEGVLDPLELAMISGAFGKSCGGVLPIINEEGKHSIYSSNCTNKTEDWQAELPDMSNTSKKVGVRLVPKHDLLAHNNATRKVVSSYGGVKTGSKGGGCRKPLSPSSLKRPASANTNRITKKDSKLQKLPVSKPGSSLLPISARSTILNVSHLKDNQTAKPAANAPKNVGLKNSFKNVRNAQNKPKTGPSLAPSQTKDPAQHSMNSLLEVQSSTHSRPLQVSRANSGPEMILDQVPPVTGLHLCEGERGSAAQAIYVPHNPSVIGAKLKTPTIPSVKSSGLRLPSPSIGFFGQSKASTSDALQHKSVGPCDRSLVANTHGPHKFGVSRPPPIPGKTPAKCATPDTLMKSNSGALNVRNVEGKIQYNCKSEPLCQKRKVQDNTEVDLKIHHPVDGAQLKEDMLMEDSESHIIDKQVLPDGGSNDLEGDNHAMILSAQSKECGGNDNRNPQLMSHYGLDSFTKLATVVTGEEGILEQKGKDKMQKTSTLNDSFSNSQCRDSIKHAAQIFSLVLDRCTSCRQDHEKSSGEQAEIRNSCSHECGPCSRLDSHCLEIRDSVCKLFGESEKHEPNRIGDIDSHCHEKMDTVRELFEGSQKQKKGSEHVEFPQPTGNELENSDVLFPHKDEKQEDGSSTQADDFYNESSVAHAQQHTLHANFSSEHCTSDSSITIEQTKVLEGPELSDQSAKFLETINHQEQANEGAAGADVSEKPPVGHAQDHALNKILFAENYCNPSTSTDHTECLKVCILGDQSAKSLEKESVCITSEMSLQFSTDRHPDDCMLLVESSSSEEPQCLEVIDTVQCILPETSGVGVIRSNVSCVNNIEIPGQSKDGGADVEQSSMEELNLHTLEVTQLTKNHEDPSHPDFRPYVSSISEAVPFDYGAPLSTESGLLVQSTQSSSTGSTLPCKVIDGLNHKVVVEEAECQMEGLNDIMGTSYYQIQYSNVAHQEVGGIGNILESPLGDAQVQLLDGDIFDEFSSRLMSISHDHALRIDGPNDVFVEQPGPDISLKVQQVFENHQLLWKDKSFPDSEEFQEEDALESATNLQEEREVSECPPEISNVISPVPPAELKKCLDSITADLPSVENSPSGSHGIHSAEYNDFLGDTQFWCKMELSRQSISSVDSRLEVRKGQTSSTRTACTEFFSVSEESLLTGSTSSKKLYREQPEVSNSCLEAEEVFANKKQEILNDLSFSKKITDSEEFHLDNVLEESLRDYPVQIVIYERDPESPLHLSEDRRKYVADAPLVTVEPTEENSEYCTDGQLSHDMEIAGHSASEIYSKLSEDHTAGVSTTCKELFSVCEEPCSIAGEDTNVLKFSSQPCIGLEVLETSSRDKKEYEIFQEDNCFTSEMGHELHAAWDFKMDKNSSASSMKLDLSLIKHLPNAVPFSDEWLAAIEAAGEDILTLKSGAVQNSPPDKYLHKPGPYSPVKRKNNQLGPFDCTKFGNANP